LPSREKSLATDLETQSSGTIFTPPAYTGDGSDGHHYLRSVLDKALRKGGNGFYNVSVQKITPPPVRANFRSNRDDHGFLEAHQHRLLSRIARPVGAIIPPPAGPEPDKICDACGLRGHSVRRCLWTSREGDMPACPFCERYSEHLPENCPRRAEFDDEHVWQFFVLNRGGKSHFRTGDVDLMWPNIVRARLVQRPQEEQQRFYPHSRGFALEQQAANPLRYRTYDYRYEPLGLVADPRTTNRDSLLQDEELALPYQADMEQL
jgi:hypothetical protein